MAASTSPRCSTETGEDVAALVKGRRPVGHGREGVGDRLQDLVLDLDERGGGPRLAARLGGHGGQHVTHVAGGLALRDELVPVVVDEPLVALAGHVRGGQHGHHAGRGEGPRDVDAPHDGARMIGEAQRAVEHAGHDVVGHVLLEAEHLLAPAVARGARADAVTRLQRRPRTTLAGGRDLLDGVDDGEVAGAAAEVAGQRLGDGVAVRLGFLAQQRLRLHHDARRAVAALRGAGGREGVGPQVADVLAPGPPASPPRGRPRARRAGRRRPRPGRRR